MSEGHTNNLQSISCTDNTGWLDKINQT